MNPITPNVCANPKCENEVAHRGLCTDCRLSLNNRPQGHRQADPEPRDGRNQLERLLGVQIPGIKEHKPSEAARLNAGFAMIGEGA